MTCVVEPCRTIITAMNMLSTLHVNADVSDDGMLGVKMPTHLGASTHEGVLAAHRRFGLTELPERALARAMRREAN